MKQATTAISFGDRVQLPRGSTGRVHAVLLDRRRLRVQAMVLHRGLAHAAFVLPLEAIDVVHEPGERPQLQTRVREWPVALPRGYRPKDVRAALRQQALISDTGTSGSGEADDGVVLRGGHEVHGPDGYVGQLKRLVLRWPEGNLVALVVRFGRLRRRYVRIPVASIVGWADDQIHIGLGRADRAALPEYRTDASLRSAIHAALHNDDAIRRVDGGMIAVHVTDGRVTLAGHVADGRNRARAETVARNVAGVRRVTNEIVTDAALMQDVAHALTHIEPASRVAVDFSVRHGAVSLYGAVPDARVRFAVETVVADMPAIRLIINAVRSPDTPEPALNQRTVQPRRGQNVFARDGYVGRIERVVMDPRLRQVTAIVVDGPAQRADHNWLNAEPLRQRRHILPAHTIQSHSSVDVFLTIDSRAIADAAAAVPPESHTVPPAWWQPPFPYRREEVLLEAPAMQAVAKRWPIATDSQLITLPGRGSLPNEPQPSTSSKKHLGVLAVANE